MADRILNEAFSIETLYSEPAWIKTEAFCVEVLYSESGGGPPAIAEPDNRLRHGKQFYEGAIYPAYTGGS